ncbi:MAG TPA: hypothetical protein PKH07_12595 [bacterium]|nr:hypothetical protein [bacterium]
MDLVESLRLIAAKFDEEGIDYALCGGLAMAVYAMPRGTLDIDLLIEERSLDRANQTLRVLGFEPTGVPMEFQSGKVFISRFRRIDCESGRVVVLDLVHVSAANSEAWKGRCDVEWEGSRLKVVSPQGLILLKSLRQSGQDQDDIEYLRGITDED